MANARDVNEIRKSIERIAHWMNEHGAPLLTANLASGASAQRLDEVEAELGAALPSELRALWSVHDGQREEGNGFVGAYDLLSTQRALDERESALALIRFTRESPQWAASSGATSTELGSNHWLPFAARDADALLVHGITGRVFRCDHDDAPELLASSLVEWFQRYAARVEADDYAVEEGFGDYYLELRDREAERQRQEREQRAVEHERVRRETSLLDRFRDAVETKREDRCIEVLRDALDRNERAAFHAAVALLFADGLDPKFVASALRPSLNTLTLLPDQWVDIAVGGAQLDNNAIVDVAVSRAEGFSVARLQRLEATIAGAASGERDALAKVLQKLREKWPSAGHSSGNGGGWFSRLLGRRTAKK
ncbi:MAG TPA: SMI1/KNR4 family protein [Polyangiaceae bacterium]|nr:SMI1/KNR4 family protein [Polyangiaceae bacterium]